MINLKNCSRITPVSYTHLISATYTPVFGKKSFFSIAMFAVGVPTCFPIPRPCITAVSYTHLVMGKNEFLVHCDTWNYMDGIGQGLKQQPELTCNGWTLTVAETPILTEPMDQYQMAGTKGYVLVLPDEAASQLVGDVYKRQVFYLFVKASL